MSSWPARWRGALALRIGLLALLLPVLLLSVADGRAATIVRYPLGEGYAARLLRQALLRSGVAYQVEVTDRHTKQDRLLVQLQHGDDIDVINCMTTAEREQLLRPVRIPIDKGLIGLRLMLIDKSQVERFGRLDVDAGLKAMRAGQGSDWPDTAILRANGFNVFSTTNYGGLYLMLNRHRIDYFPRSILEIWNEAELYRDVGIVVEPSLLLRYPAAEYFFVSRNNPSLAVDLEAGLEKMIADGSLDKMFYEQYGELIKHARIARRRVVHLRNPMMPASLPVGR